MGGHYKKKFVVVLLEDAGYKLGKAGDYYHFLSRRNYDGPQFGDLHSAKRMAAQGAASVKRVLTKEGYKVSVKELS